MGSPGAVLDSFQLGLHLLLKKTFLCPVCQGGYIRVKLVLSELGLTGLLDIYSIVCTHTYMGHFPKLCTKSVTFAVRIQNNWLLFSTLLQQFLSKTSGLSKWTKQCNIFKYKEKWTINNINCKKAAYRCINLSLFNRVKSTTFPWDHPHNMWPWISFTDQITPCTLNKLSTWSTDPLMHAV